MVRILQEHPRELRRGKVERSGIAMLVIVVCLVIVVAVAGSVAYYVIVINPSSTPTTGGSTTQSAGSQTTTSTTTSTFSVSLPSTSSATSTASTLAGTTYDATFQYSLPLGPFGEIVEANNTVETFHSVQNGSGSFVFTVFDNGSGTGSGHGIMNVTTTGFCSGSTIFPYTFSIPDATNILGGNITIFMGDPAPVNFTVPLTCTATPPPSQQNGNTFPFLATYPNEITVKAIPVTVDEHLSGNISYSYTITPAS